MNGAPRAEIPRVRCSPRRWLGLLLFGLLIAAAIGFGLKLQRYRAAYDAVVRHGGTVTFRGPAWARRMSPEKPLPYLDEVTAVDMRGCRLTPEYGTALLQHLQQFPELKSLNLSGNAVPDSAAAHFARLGERLETLDLSRTDIGNGVAQNLQHLRGLRVLDLSNTQITDAGLPAIAALHNLRQLNLDHTPVSDSGLQQLGTLTRLRELNVADTDITDDGVVRLKSVLPNAEIFDD